MWCGRRAAGCRRQRRSFAREPFFTVYQFPHVYNCRIRKLYCYRRRIMRTSNTFGSSAASARGRNDLRGSARIYGKRRRRRFTAAAAGTLGLTGGNMGFSGRLMGVVGVNPVRLLFILFKGHCRTISILAALLHRFPLIFWE